MHPQPRLRACLTIAVLFSILSAVLVPAPAAAQVGAELSAAAATSSFSTLPPAADAYVALSAPNDNFGADDTLRVAAALSPPVADRTLLYFELGALPAGTEVLTATLNLYQVAAATANGKQWLYAANSAWQEASVTASNAPKWFAGPWPVAFETPQQANVAVQVDVTQFVHAWLDNPGLPNKGFAIVPVPPTGLAAATADAALEPVERVYSSREGERPPLLTVEYRLPPVRVCSELADPCEGIAGAEVYNLDTGAVYVTDATGAITTANSIALGHRLWARAKTNAGDAIGRSTLYRTTAEPVEVQADAFTGGNAAVLPVAVTAAAPLRVVNLDVSAQWHFGTQGDSTRDYLRDQILAASDYLYAFTDGQFALGEVAVRQGWEGWEEADLRLYANNALRPKAIIGGSVTAETPDVWPTVPITYYPGPMSMGSYWNRFAKPRGQAITVGGQPVPPEVLADDWALAFAHELGHWLLFLFDTYTGVDGTADGTLADLCTGTAMGDVYEPLNHGYIFDQTHWDVNCAGTEAHARLNGRTEWDTIAAWYPEVATPGALVDGPIAPAMTEVVFVPPTTTLPSSVGDGFTLQITGAATPTGEARVFLFQGSLESERVVEQGKPSAGAGPGSVAAVAPVGAALDDRLCVYDIHPAADPAQARHLFGCKVIAAGDATLTLTEDLSWAPQIAVQQTGAQQVRLEVVQTVAAPQVLKARLYPEDGPLLTEVTLSGAAGGSASVTVDLPVPVPPLYVQVFVDEPVEEPVTRREIVADRGVGGGGAFGPKRLYGGAPVQSSDGNATFEFGAAGVPEPGSLDPGASIAWQSMAGTPPLPAHSRALGQGYRLDAYPPALVADGAVNLRYTVQAADAAQAGEAEAAVFFWNGSAWEKLPTVLSTPVAAVDGEGLATAASRGPGVYFVLVGNPVVNTFLPLIQAQP